MLSRHWQRPSPAPSIQIHSYLKSSRSGTFPEALREHAGWRPRHSNRLYHGAYVDADIERFLVFKVPSEINSAHLGSSLDRVPSRQSPGNPGSSTHPPPRSRPNFRSSRSLRHPQNPAHAYLQGQPTRTDSALDLCRQADFSCRGCGDEKLHTHAIPRRYITGDDALASQE
jgi:hypothetical protein